MRMTWVKWRYVYFCGPTRQCSAEPPGFSFMNLVWRYHLGSHGRRIASNKGLCLYRKTQTHRTEDAHLCLDWCSKPAIPEYGTTCLYTSQTALPLRQAIWCFAQTCYQNQLYDQRWINAVLKDWFVLRPLPRKIYGQVCVCVFIYIYTYYLPHITANCTEQVFWRN